MTTPHYQPAKADDLKPLLVDNSTAKRLLGGVSVKTLYNWRAQGILRAVNVPGCRSVLYRVADLEAFVNQFSSELQGGNSNG